MKNSIPKNYKTLQQVREEVEKKHISKSLKMTGWNLEKTCRILDVSTNLLKDRINRFDLKKK